MARRSRFWGCPLVKDSRTATRALPCGPTATAVCWAMTTKHPRQHPRSAVGMSGRQWRKTVLRHHYGPNHSLSPCLLLMLVEQGAGSRHPPERRQAVLNDADAGAVKVGTALPLQKASVAVGACRRRSHNLHPKGQTTFDGNSQPHPLPRAGIVCPSWSQPTAALALAGLRL